MATMIEKPPIRLIKGYRITTKAELDKFTETYKDGHGFLAGSASNIEVAKFDSYLYDKADIYGNYDLRIPADRFANANVVIGAQGSGKTNFIDNLIASFPDNRKIIHDPKMEAVQKFYNPKKGDIIIAYPHAESVIWDVLGEIAKDKDRGQIIFENMVNATQGDSKDDYQWVIYARDRLMRLANETLELASDPKDYAATWLDRYAKLRAEIGDDRFETSALGTAEPIIDLIFRMYFIAWKDNRRLVTVDDIAKARNVFLCNTTKHAQQLKIINNALLALLVGYDMARPKVKRGDLKNYIFYILEEYLNFKLDVDSETALLTMCRAKGVSVWLLMQFLPKDEEKRKRIMASRYASVVFSTGDIDTIETFSKQSVDITYQRYDTNMSTGQDNSLLSAAGPSFTDNWITVETKQLTKDVLLSLSPYVAYLELELKDPGVPTVTIKTFFRPVHVIAPEKNPEWFYSDVARNAPFLADYMGGGNADDDEDLEEVSNG